jgi:hypothetical protein
MCTDICPATWTWQHNGMGDMQKHSGCGVFFVCGQIFVWGLGLGNTNGMGDTYEGKKKF